MVVEHTFITTLEATDVLRRVAVFLGQRGFRFNVLPEAMVEGGQAASLHAVAGKASTAVGPAWGRLWGRPAASINDSFREVRLEFDRGRVNVAVSGEPWGRGRRAIGEGRCQGLLVGIANAMDILIASGDENAAAMEWDSVERPLVALSQADGRRRRRTTIIVITFCAICVVLMIFAIVSSSPRR